MRRHARAHRLEVTLTQTGGELLGTVIDDGRGFDVRRALDRHRARLHLGLDATIERIRLAGGTIDIDSTPARAPGSSSGCRARPPRPRRRRRTWSPPARERAGPGTGYSRPSHTPGCRRSGPGCGACRRCDALVAGGLHGRSPARPDGEGYPVAERGHRPATRPATLGGPAAGTLCSGRLAGTPGFSEEVARAVWVFNTARLRTV